MDLVSNLALGFSTAASPENLAFCLIGVLLGTLIGVLPGIGATATIEAGRRGIRTYRRSFPSQQLTTIPPIHEGTTLSG